MDVTERSDRSIDVDMMARHRLTALSHGPGDLVIVTAVTIDHAARFCTPRTSETNPSHRFVYALCIAL
ncbi:hypothetical protein JYU34_002612 [Plutella xylostella]|uniref:Uncharacterized protein n=1 Tax=Plutella xylostella TaxID=51655 RepID=A0ABQ7R2U2_PLUXY|nr:hypothetical protein JYU34_002612 [Plutella xylostella]